MNIEDNVTQQFVPQSLSPFSVGGIIKEADSFWGRKREFDFLMNRIQKKESTAIIGPRRIGKSSLAYQAYSYCKEHHNDDFVLGWVDGQSPKTLTVNGLFEAISNELGSWI